MLNKNLYLESSRIPAILPVQTMQQCGAWGCQLPGDTGLSAALDCTGVAVGCSSEGRAVAGHGSQIASYRDNHIVVALSSPACNTSACVGHHGGVVQLSSSSHQVSPSPRL